MRDRFKTETDKYIVEYINCDSEGKSAVVVTSKDGSGRKAVHTTFSLMDANGSLKAVSSMTQKAAELILKGFSLKGETESFVIFEDEMLSGVPRISKVNVNLEEVRHHKTMFEKNYTATGDKLTAHWPIFKKFKQTGYASIIRATMTLHQVCSSRCPYCSTIRRNKADSISLEEAKAFVNKLSEEQAAFNREHFSEWNELYKKVRGTDIKLRGLILSGGGQPNLWPNFVQFVEWCAAQNIDLGLITNGFPANVPEKTYELFTWVRLSITPEDASPHYPAGRCDHQYIPDILKHSKRTTFGLSYVYGPWTTDDILIRIVNATEDWGATYCRFLVDCNLTRSAQLAEHKNLAERLFKLGFIDSGGMPLRPLFHQLKYHGEQQEGRLLWEDGFCFLQLYNAFWDTTGHDENGFSWVYPCDSVTVLSEECDDGLHTSDRKFSPNKWGTVTNLDVDKLYKEPLKHFFDPKKLCNSCLFMKNNRIVKELVEREDFDDIAILPNIDHINFP